MVIGPVGRNFAAGMTGGVAYVLDESGAFGATICNRASVDLEPLEAEDASLVESLIRRHHALTCSPHARDILEHWDLVLPKFVKVFPLEYKRVLRMNAEKSGKAKEVVHG